MKSLDHNANPLTRQLAIPAKRVLIAAVIKTNPQIALISSLGDHRLSFRIPRRLPWLLLISALIFLADRWTKTWVG